MNYTQGSTSAAEFACAEFAGAHGTEIIEAVNSRGMSVREIYFYGVVSDGLSAARAGFWFVHRQNAGRHWCRSSCRRWNFGRFFRALISACGARTIFAQINKIVVAGVAVRPDNVHTRAGGDVNLHVGGFLTRIEWSGHFLICGSIYRFGQQSPGGIGFPCGHVCG